MRFLIVDDSQTTIRQVRQDLEILYPDAQIDESMTAVDALQKMKRHTYDCVFLDYILKGLTGLDVLKRMNDKEHAIPSMPVVIMTAHGNENVVIEALRLGAQDYLTKGMLNKEALKIAIIKATLVYDLKRSQNDTQKQLNKSQKMEAFGQLSGGIAHDFNNILTILIGQMNMLENELGNPFHSKNAKKEIISKVMQTLNRGSDLVRRLMIFARQRDINPKKINLHAMIKDIKKILGRTLGDHIDVMIDPKSCSECYAMTEAALLEQAIINMAINARDAMPDGGKISIKCGAQKLSSQSAKSLDLTSGEYSYIQIKDDGLGIPEDVQDKIFEPFFTTKDVGAGTGLGLSMVYSFMRDCHGAVEMESERGQGTCFTLYFPKAELNARDTQRQNDKEETDRNIQKGDGQTILVVEDEEEILFLTKTMLSAHGYSILQASNADEAMDILTQQNEIDLLFTDISMPGEMNGVQLAGRATALRPDLKLLFTTGFDDGAIPDMNLARQYDVLNKPYQPDKLYSAIYKALAA